MNREQKSLAQSGAMAVAPPDLFADPAQTAHWRALVTQKVKRKAALLQQQYQEQRAQDRAPAGLSLAPQHEQLFHIIELNFYQLADWPTVVACVLSADDTMQRRAILDRWGELLVLAGLAARHLGDPAAEAGLTFRLGKLRAQQGQLRAADVCFAEAEQRFNQLGLTAQLPKVWCQQAQQSIRQGDYDAATAALLRAERQLQQTANLGQTSLPADSAAYANEAIDLYCTWGLLANNQGDPQAAIRWYEKALTVAPHAALSEAVLYGSVRSSLGLAHERLGSIYCYVGNYEAALTHLTAAQRIAEVDGNDGLLCRILSLTGTVWGIRGQLARSIEYFQQVYVVAERCGYLASLMGAHSNLAVSYYRLGQFPQALQAVRRSLQLTKRLEHPVACLNSLINECEILCALVQPAAAHTALAEAETLLATLDHTPLLTAFVTGARARLTRLEGDVVGAIDHFLAAIALIETIENRFETAEFAIELVPLYLAQQNWAEAETWIEVIRTLGQALQQNELLGQAAALAGDLARLQGDAAGANNAYQAALAAFQAEANDRNRYLAAQLAERTRLAW